MNNRIVILCIMLGLCLLASLIYWDVLVVSKQWLVVIAMAILYSILTLFLIKILDKEENT